MNRFSVVLVGTEPGGGRGGIQTSMAALRDALEEAGVPCEVVVSHRVVSLRGKAGTAAAALRELVETVGRIRGQDRTPVVYAQAGEWPSMARKATLLTAARARGARTVLHLRATEMDGYLGRRVGRRFVRRTAGSADVVAVATRWWRERLEGIDIGRPVRVIPNPLPRVLEDIARSRESPPAHPRDGPLRVLALTRLIPGKGVEDTIHAAIASRALVHLTVAGDGPERARLEGLARRGLPSARVAFPGWLGEDAVRRAYRDADVFCLPTMRDSFGMVLVEAMAHGIPVLARRWGPIPEVVPDGVAGLLVDAPVVPNLARALAELADPERRRELGEGGRNWVLERLGRAVIGERLREVLGKVASA